MYKMSEYLRELSCSGHKGIIIGEPNGDKWYVFSNGNYYSIIDKYVQDKLHAGRALLDTILVFDWMSHIQGGPHGLFAWDEGLIKSLPLRVSYNKSGKRALIDWIGENGQPNRVVFSFNRWGGWEDTVVHNKFCETITPPICSQLSFLPVKYDDSINSNLVRIVNNQLWVMPSTKFMGRYDTLNHIAESVVHQSANKVVVDMKYWSPAIQEHSLYTAHLVDGGILLEKELLEDSWWGSNLPPLAYLATPYNRSMHHFLHAPSFKGDWLWIPSIPCGRVFIKQDSGKWIPFALEKDDISSITEYFGICLSNDVREEYEAYVSGK